MTQGDITFFRRKFFVSQFRIFSLGTLHSFRKLLAAKTKFGCELHITFLQQMFFCLKLPKNFIAISSLFQKNFLSSKTFHGMAGKSVFCQTIFLSRVIEKTQWEQIGVPKNFWWRKFLWMREWDITFFFRYVFVWLYRKLSLETLRCFKKTLAGIKICMDEGVGYHVFPSKTFCLTLPKNFTGNSSSLREDSDSDDVLWMGGHVKFFRRSFFVSHYRKFSLESLRGFRKNWYRRKYMDKTGGIPIFRHICFCLILPKNFIENFRCFRKILLARKFHAWEKGSFTFFCPVAIFLYHSFKSSHWELSIASESF